MDLMSENHYKEYGLFTFMEARKSAIKSNGFKCLESSSFIVWCFLCLKKLPCFLHQSQRRSCTSLSCLSYCVVLLLTSLLCLIENVMVPVQTTDYIMDVVSSMERQEFAFSLCFRRVLWLQGLRLDNELLVSVIYHQVKTGQTGSGGFVVDNG